MTVDDRLRDYAARWNAAGPPPPTPGPFQVADVRPPTAATPRRPQRLLAVAAVGLVLVVGGGMAVGEVVHRRTDVVAVTSAAAATPTPDPVSTTGVTPTGTVIPPTERVAAADVSGTAMDGRTWDLAAHRGQVVVLAIFGSWCGPCGELAPSLNGVAGPGVDVVGFAVLEPSPTVTAQFVAEHGITYPVVSDSGTTTIDPLGPLGAGVPQLYLVDRQGRIAAHHLGADARSGLPGAVADLTAE